MRSSVNSSRVSNQKKKNSNPTYGFFIYLTSSVIEILPEIYEYGDELIKEWP